MEQKYPPAGKDVHPAETILRYTVVALLVIPLCSFIPPDKKAIRSTQTERTKLFAGLLEAGKLDSIISLVDPEFLSDDTNAISDLSLAYKALQQTSYFRHDIHDNFLSCRNYKGMNYFALQYSHVDSQDTTGFVLTVQLIYDDSDSNAVIKNLKFYSPVHENAKQELEQERARKRRLEEMRADYERAEKRKAQKNQKHKH
jgi:hypothetical protein